MSGLVRPESVAFNESGSLIVAGNSSNFSLSVYSRIGRSGDHYHSTPYYRIINRACLAFVHDAVFTPCGRYVVAVGRDVHALSMFALNGKPNDNGGIDEQRIDAQQKEDEPVLHISGEDSQLSCPGGLSIHPSGNWLAVANRNRFGITLYRKKEGNFDFESTPFQSITVEELARHDLATPQGIDFSSDGKSLIVTHKPFFLNEDDRGKSGLSVFQWRDDSEGLKTEPSHIMHYGEVALHSVAFHPNGAVFAVTDENGGVEIYRMPNGPGPMMKLNTLMTLPGKEGPKGIAFSRDGELLAFSTVFNEVLIYRVIAVCKRKI